VAKPRDGIAEAEAALDKLLEDRRFAYLHMTAKHVAVRDPASEEGRKSQMEFQAHLVLLQVLSAERTGRILAWSTWALVAATVALVTATVALIGVSS
jgi:hypothetical protein